MQTYVIRRLLLTIPTLFGVTVFIFLIMRVLPVITLSGLQLAGILSGMVAVERALGIPGLGFALINAIDQRDWMVIQNLVLLFGVIYVFVNLAVDLTYAWIDPRIRYR